MIGKQKHHLHYQKPQALQAAVHKDEYQEREERRRADLEQLHNRSKRLRK